MLGCCLSPHLGADLQARDKDKEEEKSCPAEATKLSRTAVLRAVFAWAKAGAAAAGGMCFRDFR